MVRSFTAFLEKRNHAVVPTTTRFVLPTPLGRLANLPDRQAAIPRLHRRNPSYDAATVADATTATALISGGSALLGALVGGGVTIAAEVLRARGTRAERERDRRVAVDDLQRETLMQLQDAMTKWAMTVDDVETAYTWSMPWPTLTSRTGRPQLVRWSSPSYRRLRPCGCSGDTGGELRRRRAAAVAAARSPARPLLRRFCDD